MKPLLFPTPLPVARVVRPAPRAAPRVPSFERQETRLDRQLNEIRAAFAARRAWLQQHAYGVAPEEVLVLETVGTVSEFQNAVRRVAGLEWLGQWDDQFEPDDDFFDSEEAPNRIVDGTLFLVMTNQSALAKIEQLWQQYRASRGTHVERNFGKWRDVFTQLREIRFWGPSDRLRGTMLLENLEFELSIPNRDVHVEAELWFCRDATQRERRAAGFRDSVLADGGTIISEVVIEECAYHGMILTLPTAVAGALRAGDFDQFIARDSLVMFLRPTGQTGSRVLGEDPMERPSSDRHSVPSGEPRVALLDGLPLTGHQWLAERILVDDPDDFGANYPAHLREHGTAMASVLIYGDRSTENEPLSKPLYVRPVLGPQSILDERFEERMPANRPPVDLLLRCFKRMFEGDESGGAVAPSVRIVNFSLGDKARQFDRSISSWARVFDWVSYRYNVLIFISTGNFEDELLMPMSASDWNAADPETRQAEFVRSVHASSTQRRLLVPAESINSLTIAGIHDDASGLDLRYGVIDVVGSCELPSPLNRVGLGYRRAIKPELLMPAGRQLYLSPTDAAVGTMELSPALSGTDLPGVLAAAPSTRTGSVTGSRYIRGTSVATALASREASRVFDLVESMRQEPGGTELQEDCFPVLVKALLVHGARWPTEQRSVREVFTRPDGRNDYRAAAAKLFGYGIPNVDRVLESTEQRVTLLGTGVFHGEGGQKFQLPLPAELSNQRTWRSLSVTLAWLTPIQPSSLAYRKAALSIGTTADQIRKRLGVSSIDGDSRWSKNGTIQHLVFSGSAARQFSGNDELEIKVFCRSDAGELDGEPIRFGIAVTLEIDSDSKVPIYSLISQRIRPGIRVPVR